jgi:hypothetical protein
MGEKPKNVEKEKEIKMPGALAGAPGKRYINIKRRSGGIRR